jgi:hypothetical protein
MVSLETRLLNSSGCTEKNRDSSYLEFPVSSYGNTRVSNENSSACKCTKYKQTDTVVSKVKLKVKLSLYFN